MSPTVRSSKCSTALVRAARPRRSRSASSRASRAIAPASFGALLSGDRAQLEQHYRVASAGTREHWTLTLTPRRAELAAKVRGITLHGRGAELRDGILYRGRTGVGWLALTTGAPVVPVGLIGTEHLQPADSKSVKPQHFTMKVGAPLYFDKTGPDHSLPARRQATDRIMDAIAELSGQERSTSYNQSKSAE